MCKGDNETMTNTSSEGGGVPVKLLLDQGILEQYLKDRPESVRRIETEMQQDAPLRGEQVSPMATSLMSGPTSSSGVPALTLMEQGSEAFAAYLEERPESTRRVQEELRGCSLLSGGRKKEAEIAEMEKKEEKKALTEDEKRQARETAATSAATTTASSLAVSYITSARGTLRKVKYCARR